MKNIMLLKPEDYYTQRNNPTVENGGISLSGNVQCMPTARVMFYIAAGIEYKNPTDMPDDAYFASLLISDDAIEFARVKYPWAFEEGKNVIPPNEIHGMYGSYLDEIVTGKRRTDFKTDLTWKDFVSEMKKKKPIMTSGQYPGIPGHATVFVGYDCWNKELRNVDPFGNPHLAYHGTEGIKGYDIRYNKKYFNEHIKKTDYKWGHILI